MIISHKHKFIFIKTRKTAGSSIELALARFCGERDVVTPMGSISEPLRADEDVGPRNYRGLFNPIPDIAHELSSEKSPVFKGRFLGDHPVFRKIPAPLMRLPAVAANLLTARRYFNHIAAEVVRHRVGKEIWNSYFKFCFERNPWEKTVSHYHFRRESMQQAQTFDQYFVDGFFCSDFDAYSIGGAVAVDFVGRFENLQAELREACDRIGIGFDGWLPRANPSEQSREKRPYQSYYTEERRSRIAEIFSREIEHFGYAFDGDGGKIG